MHAYPSDIRNEDKKCFDFLESIQRNAKRITNDHMFQKYVSMGYAFVYDNPKGQEHLKFKYLLDKYWIYPPGGRAGYLASLLDMGWI